MSDIIVDGRTRVAAVPSINNLLAATVAELNAGTLLQSKLTPTGFEGFESTQAEVDNSSMASTFDTKLPGRPSFSNTRLMLKKQDQGIDPVFTLLTTPNTNLFLVVRDELDEGIAWATGQRYEVYPVRTGIHSIMGRNEQNSVLKYAVPVPISDFKAAYLKGIVA